MACLKSFRETISPSHLGTQAHIFVIEKVDKTQMKVFCGERWVQKCWENNIWRIYPDPTYVQGFEEEQAKTAAFQSHNCGVEAAVNWLVEHPNSNLPSSSSQQRQVGFRVQSFGSVCCCVSSDEAAITKHLPSALYKHCPCKLLTGFGEKANYFTFHCQDSRHYLKLPAISGTIYAKDWLKVFN